MFPLWRLKLREVQVAAASGRYDDAIALLERDSLREFLPAKRLAQDVAGKMVERAGQQFAHGDSAAGWQDLAIADRLGGQAEAVGAVRQQYTERSLEEVSRYLAAGQPAAALARLEKLRRKNLLHEAGRLYLEIATLLAGAQRAAEHGRFVEASAALDEAHALAAKSSTAEGTMDIVRHIESQRGQFANRQEESQRLAAELHAALTQQDWGAVLTAAEALLAIAPRHEAARHARRRAWQAVGMNVTRAYQVRRPAGNISLQLNAAAGRGGRKSTRPGARSNEDDTVSGAQPPERAVLWVDAVGGFLVCLDNEVVLGQPAGGLGVAVPILADLSRRHAVIRRDDGAYVLEPIQAVRVDGRELTGPTVLADGQVIQLGDSVKIRFRKPHALSATARLDFESHHKTQPSADAVLLMADSCVMGPSSHCHIRTRDWEHDVVIYRQGERLHARSAAPLAVDGEPRDGAVEIQTGERVEGEGFSFTWERVE
jgi:FHA domain